MASYGSVPQDGTKQVAYEVTPKGALLTTVVLSPPKEETKTPGSANWVMDTEVRDKELARWEKLASEGASRAPPALVPCLQACAPWFSWVVVCFEACLPFYVRGAAWVVQACAALPAEELSILGGLILCFFGGSYPMTLAAAEAWKQCGGDRTREAIEALHAQFLRAKAASDADDLVDEDGDGIADVDQISAKELAARKARLTLTATDPKVLNDGLNGCYTGFAAVVAVLKLRFAKVVALGAAIGNCMVRWSEQPGTALLSHLLKPDLHKWIPSILNYSCKIVAVIVCYQIQKVVSAFYSAIRGGLLVARSLLRVLARRGIVNIDPDNSYVDEVAGWSLAAVGFGVQLSLGFSPPFLVSLLLWPLGVTEASLVWAVNSPGPGGAPAA